MAASAQSVAASRVNTTPSGVVGKASPCALSTGGSALEVEAQPYQGEVPADADRARTELAPHLGLDVRLVGKLEDGAVARSG